MTKAIKEEKTIHVLLPILFLLAVIMYGLVLRPFVFHQESIPLEIIFLCSSYFAVCHLLILGYQWQDIFTNAINKLVKGLPTILVLFAIGIVIGSWIICGTIPMFIYFGIKLVDPDYIYLISFVVPIFFSLFTGTSYGSVGTIGIVLLGIATLINANLAIVAGAIIGGAFFGDKLSPLSDTTNIAALATQVNLYDHINSMMYTTMPSAAVAAIIYTILGFVYPVESNVSNFAVLEETLVSVKSIFNFNIILITPILIVLLGSFKKLPTIPILLSSSLVACIFTFIFQDYSFNAIIQTIYKGYNTDMATWQPSVAENLQILFNRGGLYALNEAIMIAIFVFLFIGILDTNHAILKIVDNVFYYAKTRTKIILSSLLASGITNMMTGSQYATSFIVGEAFRTKYDALKINRKVLSRSLEDYGTMIESFVPWHPTALFMYSVLGVSVSEYWNYQLLGLANLVIAPLFAILGIGCFYNSKR